MKKNIHPKYQQVLFVDSATGTKFVCGSTISVKETDTFEGVDYPLCRVSISSASHPFFTGSKQLVDAEGRVDKFRKRYAKAALKKEESPEESQEDSTDSQEDSTDSQEDSTDSKEKIAPKAAPKKSTKKK